jgi:hypothetical protein
MAFQANAFQSDAFQICASTKPDVALQRRRARRRQEEIDKRRQYEHAREVLELVESEEITAQLDAVILPFRKEEDVDMAALMAKGQAKRRLEQILTSIRQLEDEMLELLALLLLANEAL